MNNYLYANLATGKLTRGISGGGQSGNLPIFIIGEENKFNLYFVDFPKPSTYPSPALGDNFFYEPKTQVINNDITIRAGTKIGEYIINDSILAAANNLNRTVSASSTVTVQTEYNSIITGTSGIRTFYFSGNVTLNGPTPVEGSFLTPIGNLPYYFSGYEIQQLVQNFGDAEMFRLYFPVITGSDYSAAESQIPQKGIVSVDQTGDFSYSFSYLNFVSTSETKVPYSGGSTSSSASLLGPAGKYGVLNFNSPSWDTIIGTNEETTIWLEIVISNQVIAQGSAILRKRLTS